MRAAAFLVAAVFWTIGSLHRSLWEDEFHSLYHARAGSVLGLLESVRNDNHPPLSFLLQKLSCDLLGESVFALRLPTLLAGLGLFLVFLRLSRRLPDSPARAWAPWLAACSSYLFWIVTTARMYSWVALATLGLVASSLSALAGERSRWWIAPWIALGLYSHYHFFHHLALLGLAVLVLQALAPARRRELSGSVKESPASREPAGCDAARRADDAYSHGNTRRRNDATSHPAELVGGEGFLHRPSRLALPVLVGLALFLPWGAFGFWRQLGTGDPPTSSHRGFSVWAESYAHFLFVNSRAGGLLLYRALALPGALAGALLGILGTVRLVREIRAGGATALSVVLLVLGVLGPSWTYLANVAHPRSGFHLKYLASYAAPALLIVAAGTTGALWRRALGGFLLLAMLGITIANVASRGSEDVEGAVRFIREHAQPGDAVMTRPCWHRDPERSPTDYGWYARRMAPGENEPVEIPVGRAADAFAYGRVWLIHSMSYRRWVLEMLAGHFRSLETFRCSREVAVYLYTDPREGQH